MNQTQRTADQYKAAIAKHETLEQHFAELMTSSPEFNKERLIERVMVAYYTAKLEELQK